MLTEAELSELLEIRKQIDALQARYDQLAAAMAAAPAPVVPPRAQPKPVEAAPVQPQVQQPANVPETSQPQVQAAPRGIIPKAAPAKGPLAGALLRAGAQKAAISSAGRQQVKPGGLPPRLGIAKAGAPSAKPAALVRPQGPLIQRPIQSNVSEEDRKPETKKIALPGAFAAARAAADAAAKAASDAAHFRGAPAKLAGPAAGGLHPLTLKDCIKNVVAQAGRPISFDEVYKRLEATKAPMPGDKPKLIVRQILYNKALFKSDGRGFSLAESGGSMMSAPKKGNHPTIAAPVDKDKLFKSRLDELLKKI